MPSLAHLLPSMDAPEIIRKKRNGLVLTKAEVFDFVERYTRGGIPTIKPLPC